MSLCWSLSLQSRQARALSLTTDPHGLVNFWLRSWDPASSCCHWRSTPLIFHVGVLERGQYRSADSRLGIGDCEGMASISCILGRWTRAGTVWRLQLSLYLMQTLCSRAPDKQEHGASEWLAYSPAGNRALALAMFDLTWWGGRLTWKLSLCQGHNALPGQQGEKSTTTRRMSDGCYPINPEIVHNQRAWTAEIKLSGERHQPHGCLLV